MSNEIQHQQKFDFEITFHKSLNPSLVVTLRQNYFKQKNQKVKVKEIRTSVTRCD